MPTASIITLAKLLAAALLSVIAVAAFWPQREIEIRTAVGPDIPGRYKHAASACELRNGHILLVYYSGSGEYGRDTAIYATEYDRTSDRWSRPRIIADEPDKAEGNPVLWRAPDEAIWLFYPIRHGDTWSTARLAARKSVDEGRSWAAAPSPSEKEGLMTRARPLTLKDGTCLLPVDFNPSTDPEFVSENSGSLFLHSNRELTEWESTQIIHSRLGNHQPAAALVGEERLVAYCRRGGDYFGRADGMLVRSESTDNGRTWSAGVETQLPNPNAPVDFLQLRSGNHLLVYNDSAYERTPLRVVLSTDGDLTYPHRLDLLGEEYSYPCLLEASDGMIFLFFTAGARSHIKFTTLTESMLKGKSSDRPAVPRPSQAHNARADSDVPRV